MNKGYTTAEAVFVYLGRDLATAGLEAQTDLLIGVAETYIDRETRRTWIVPPITDERYDLTLPVLYLKQVPVASVQSVKTRTTQVGDILLTLAAGVEYELVDANLGEVRIVSGYDGLHSYALVSYTPNRPVPADISFAATLIVAESLKMTLFPDRWGLDRVQVDNEKMLQYTDGAVSILVSETAQQIITGYRKPLIG